MCAAPTRNEVFVQEIDGDWRSSPVPIASQLTHGYRVDTDPPACFKPEDLALINDVQTELEGIQSKEYINSTPVYMFNYLNIEEDAKELRQKVRQIIRTAVTEKAGDLWTQFKRSDSAPITCVLGQLKILVMEHGTKMVIHADDQDSQLPTDSRQPTPSQGRNWPVHSTQCRP